MLLSMLPHELLLKDEVLTCCDPQNPRHHPFVESSSVGLEVLHTEFGPELKIRHEGHVRDFEMCDACYEAIIKHLLRKKK